MMGPTKLSTIRAGVRASFQMTDGELLAWFNRQMQDAAQRPKPDSCAIETLRLLRDALVKETTRPATRRKTRKLTGRIKH